jgi:hypothetical protein
MNEDQYRRRVVLWLGSFPAIGIFVLLILVLLLSDRMAPAIPQIPAGSNPIPQADQSPTDTSQAIKPIQAESPLPAA